MSVINTNVNAIIAQNAGVKNTRMQTQAMQQLSTGSRINSAADDAAGLAISSKMTSQIRGLNQAVRNANDGISLIQTAEGALTEVTNMLQRMRELAVQSASDTNTADDRTALNAEFTSLRDEINRIGNNTQFNGMNVLDKSFDSGSGTFVFQVGANGAQTIDVTLGDYRTTGATSTGLTVADPSISGGAQTTTLALDASETVGSAITFTINGQTATYIATATTATNNAAALGTAYASASDGVKAFQDAVAAAIGTATANVTFSDDGAGTLTITGPAQTSFTVSENQTAAPSTSYSATVQQSDVTFSGTSWAAGDVVRINAGGSDFSHTLTAAEAATATTAATALYDAIAADVTANGSSSWASTNSVTVTNPTAGVLRMVGNNSQTFTATAEVNGVGSGDLSMINTSDITTQSNSNNAVTNLDLAIGVVSGGRATMGATINRLNYAADNLLATSANVSASRSRIQDTDYSSATTELARTQIIQQASTAMLAQANQSAQSVLSLLK